MRGARRKRKGRLENPGRWAEEPNTTWQSELITSRATEQRRGRRRQRVEASRGEGWDRYFFRETPNAYQGNGNVFSCDGEG